MRKMLELQFFFYKLLCDEGLLLSKKVTSVMGPNVKIPLDVILVLSNMIMELSYVREKNGVPQNMTKLQSKVMLVLANIIMELLNMRKKIGYY